MKTKIETSEAATRRLIADPDSWPNWPLLPVKNKQLRDTTGFPRIGVLLAGNTGLVVEGNMFEGIEKDAPSWKYDSVDAMLAAGWEVD